MLFKAITHRGSPNKIERLHSHKPMTVNPMALTSYMRCYKLATKQRRKERRKIKRKSEREQINRKNIKQEGGKKGRQGEPTNAKTNEEYRNDGKEAHI